MTDSPINLENDFPHSQIQMEDTTSAAALCQNEQFG